MWAGEARATMSNDMERDIRELKQTVESTNAALNRAIDRLETTNAAVAKTNSELNATNSRLDHTNAELNATNARLGNTNAELNSTNSRLSTTNSRLDRTMITVARLVGDMADVKVYLAENMATKKDMSDLNSRMDGFSGLLLDSRHRWAVHAETLVDHDTRIKKLETPTA